MDCCVSKDRMTVELDCSEISIHNKRVAYLILLEVSSDSPAFIVGQGVSVLLKQCVDPRYTSVPGIFQILQRETPILGVGLLSFEGILGPDTLRVDEFTLPGHHVSEIINRPNYEFHSVYTYIIHSDRLVATSLIWYRNFVRICLLSKSTTSKINYRSTWCPINLPIQVGNQLIFIVAHTGTEMSNSHVCLFRPSQIRLRDQHMTHGQHAKSTQLFRRVEYHGREPTRHFRIEADFYSSLNLILALD